MPEELPIPKTLEEAMETLPGVVGPDVVGQMRRMRASELIELHCTLGGGIRNDWGLWEDSPLHEDLLRRGVGHPDDMSTYVLDCVWRRLHALPILGYLEQTAEMVEIIRSERSGE